MVEFRSQKRMFQQIGKLYPIMIAIFPNSNIMRLPKIELKMNDLITHRNRWDILCHSYMVDCPSLLRMVSKTTKHRPKLPRTTIWT